jgi:gas vesicle protein
MEDDAGTHYSEGMLNKPLSKILLGVMFKAAVDFVSEANDERKRAKLREAQLTSQLADEATFNRTLRSASGDKSKTQKVQGAIQMDNENETSGFGPGLLLGSLIGGVIGAGLALWHAPQTGKKTQAMLKREANRLQKQVNKKANNLYASAEEIANEAAERASELTEQGREFVEEKASTLKKAVAR